MLPYYSTSFDSNHQHLSGFNNPEEFPVLFLQIFPLLPVSGIWVLIKLYFRAFLIIYYIPCFFIVFSLFNLIIYQLLLSVLELIFINTVVYIYISIIVSVLYRLDNNHYIIYTCFNPTNTACRGMSLQKFPFFLRATMYCCPLPPTNPFSTFTIFHKT